MYGKLYYANNYYGMCYYWSICWIANKKESNEKIIKKHHLYFKVIIKM